MTSTSPPSPSYDIYHITVEFTQGPVKDLYFGLPSTHRTLLDRAHRVLYLTPGTDPFTWERILTSTRNGQNKLHRLHAPSGKAFYLYGVVSEKPMPGVEEIPFTDLNNSDITYGMDKYYEVANEIHVMKRDLPDQIGPHLTLNDSGVAESFLILIAKTLVAWCGRV